jgi:hypothetical protein
MRPIRSSEVLPLGEYESVRTRVRRRMMALKERRRVAIGNHMTLLFENRETVWYQIQEMCRVERITRREPREHEVSTYNGLLPRRGELSATLLVEYESADERAKALRALRGIDRSIVLRVGNRPPVAAEFDRAQIGDDRISSVQFVRFRLGRVGRADWFAAARRGALRLEADHPAYAAVAAIPLAVARELWEDLATVAPLRKGRTESRPSDDRTAEGSRRAPSLRGRRASSPRLGRRARGRRRRARSST